MATDQAMVAFRRCVQFAPILTRVHYISATSHLKHLTNVWFRNANRKAAGMYAEQSPAMAVRVNQSPNECFGWQIIIGTFVTMAGVALLFFVRDLPEVDRAGTSIYTDHADAGAPHQ